MTPLKKTLLLSSIIVLTACAEDKIAGNDGHNHAAMQAGQRAAAPEGDTLDQASQYTCPMHPHYISDDPNGTCPICGMDLVPVPQSGSATGSGIVVSSDMIQTMGIRTTTVRKIIWDENLRVFGRVEPNARLRTSVASRLEGWVDELMVRAEGDIVRRGQRLYTIYAPDLISAQKDLLLSLSIGNERRIASVKQRLKSRGMQDSLIDRITETRELIERVPVYAESAGTVTEINVRDGDYLKPGTPLMTLQSYDQVWIIASVPESDLPKIKLGMQAKLRFDSAPNSAGLGTIDYIYPTLDTRTRTADVRLTLDNSNGVLRPGAYADIAFLLQDPVASDATLSVPTRAVLRDSRGSHVILSVGEGRYISRNVSVGRSEAGRTEILAGLTEGETIVSSGQFMLDSEANLQSGFSSGLEEAFDEKTPLAALPVDASTLGQIDHIVDAGLYFHEALIDGYDVDPYFLDPTIKLIEGLEGRFGGSKLSSILQESQTVLVQAKSQTDRDGLKDSLSRLMRALEPWLIDGNPSHYQAKGLRFFNDTETGQLWLQEGGLPANPYSNGQAILIEWPGLSLKTRP
ncbi:MAG: efflux RND transporter periplasmic adaptor subunit [Litorimonas sp.]